MLLREIFPGKELLFIAEIGLNHNGNVDIARKMIREAHKTGADAVKFQTFVPEQMNSVYTNSLINDGFEKKVDHAQADFFKKYTLSKNEYIELFALSSELKLEFFSSPFDMESVDLLEELGVKFYKIASSEVTNHILLKKIASTKKPVILSTGISNEDEISMAIDLLKKDGTTDIVLLHCVSLYPLPPETANLKRIASLKDKFGIETGFSDHSKDSRTSEIATAYGARIFEKHFTPESDYDCPDKAVSLNPEEFKNYINNVNIALKINGSGQINFGIQEKEVARLARKSLFAKRKIPKGKILTIDDVIAKRPGIGIPAYDMEKIIGRKTNIEIKEDYLLKTEYFE